MATPRRRPAALSHTIAVVLASAAARADLMWLQHRVERRFEFRLLAAAGQETPELPARGWHDLRRLLKIQALTLGSELRLSIQAEGYAALRRVAGRNARLTSADGALDVRFRFDGAGNAFAALESTASVRNALAHLRLVLDESDQAS
jgi:hypothetical protein